MTRAARAKRGNWNGTCPEYEAKRVFCRDYNGEGEVCEFLSQRQEILLSG